MTPLSKHKKEWDKKFEEEFLFGKQNLVDGEVYTIIGHQHNETCEYECIKEEKLKSYVQQREDALLEEVVKICKLEEKQFAGWHTAHAVEDYVTLAEVYGWNESLSSLISKLKDEIKT